MFRLARKLVVWWMDGDEGEAADVLKVVKSATVMYGVMFFLFFTFFISKWFVCSYFEARTFRRLTGKKVTMCQALWVQLRVEEPAVHEID